MRCELWRLRLMSTKRHDLGRLVLRMILNWWWLFVVRMHNLRNLTFSLVLVVCGLMRIGLRDRRVRVMVGSRFG